MKRPNVNLAFLLALGMAFSTAPSLSSLWAQTTLDAVNQPASSAGDKSAQRQLAKRIEKPQSDKAKNKSADDKPVPTPVPEERLAEITAFVKAHHPELQPLLKQLRAKRAKQFQTVIRTLDRNVHKLQTLEKKSPSRYKRALDHWMLTSRIQLLSAQMTLKRSAKDKASIRKKLRELFEKHHDLQRENTLVAIEAAKKKHERLQQTLKEHQANRDSAIARRLDEIDKASELVSAQRKESAKRKKSAKKENATKEAPADKTPSAKKPKSVQKVEPAQTP